MKKRMNIGGLVVAAQILGILAAFANPGKTPWRPITAATKCRRSGCFVPWPSKAIRNRKACLGSCTAREKGSLRRGARRRQDQAGIAGGIADHDAAASLAGARNGASLRGVEPSELRALIKRYLAPGNAFQAMTAIGMAIATHDNASQPSLPNSADAIPTAVSTPSQNGQRKISLAV